MPSYEIVNGTITLSSGLGDHELMTAQEMLMTRLGGGYVELEAGGLFTISGSGIEWNIGGGIGLRGNAAWLDARGINDGKSAMTFVSRPLARGTPFPGYDENHTNYHQKRVAVEGFSLIGTTFDDKEHYGIDINMSPAISTRSPRPTVERVVVHGFNRGIRHRNRAYLVSFTNGSCIGSNIALSMEGGVDQGEQTNFTNWVFGNSNILLNIDTKPETGVPENVELTFNGCSFDYFRQKAIKFVSGHGRVRFSNGSHFEWNSASPEYPFDMAETASNRMLWMFDSPNFIHCGTRIFPAPFVVGNNHDVRINDHHAHAIDGAGIQVTADKSPAGGPTFVKTMAHVIGNGRFKSDGIVDLASTSLPRVPTIAPQNNWLADGSFEKSNLVDSWYVKSGGVGTLARTTEDQHTGAGCLKCPITSGPASPKQVALLVPKRGRFVGVSAFMKLSAGSGSVSGYMAPAVCKTVPPPGTSPTIEMTGALMPLLGASLSSAGWVNTGTALNLPRHELPEWATHVLIIFDFFAVNNDGGDVYIDDVHIETW